MKNQKHYCELNQITDFFSCLGQKTENVDLKIVCDITNVCSSLAEIAKHFQEMFRIVCPNKFLSR